MLMSEGKGDCATVVTPHPVPLSQDSNTTPIETIKLSDLEDSVCIARSTLKCLDWTEYEWEVYIDSHPKVWQRLFNIRHNLKYHVDKMPYIKTLCGAYNHDPKCLQKWVRYLYKNHRLTLKKIGVQFPDDLFRR